MKSFKMLSAIVFLFVFFLAGCDSTKENPIETSGQEAQNSPTINGPQLNGYSRTVICSTSTAIQAAFNDAQPGDLIKIMAGTYTGTGKTTNNTEPGYFYISNKQGTRVQRSITIQGAGKDVTTLQGSTTASGYALHIIGGKYINISGIKFTNAQKGIVLDNTANTYFLDCVISTTTLGIRLLSGSSNCVVDASCTGCGVTTDALNPNATPGVNFDLSIYNLQLPSGTTGSPTTKTPSQLVSYTDAYFYTDKTDGAMAMMDPTLGVATSGSNYPRSEFRELYNGSTAGWSTSLTNILTVTEKVTKVSDHTCIGQIFQAPPAPSKPLLEVSYYSTGAIQVMINQTNAGSSGIEYSVGSVPLGTTFTYSLSLTGTTIIVTINGVASTFTLPPSYVGENFYFKAGNYNQSKGCIAIPPATPNTIPNAIVEMYTLSVVHTSTAHRK
jgi:hypothetical protein